MPEKWFFNTWEGVLRILIVGPLIYFVLILYLRLFGKRSLTKMNAFDFLVTVALGSLLATVVVSKTLPLAEGAAALFLLLLLQFLITWLSARSEQFDQIVKSNPTLLCYRGEMLQDNLRAERVSKEEVRAAVRAQGLARLEDVEAVILETNGTFSVVKKSNQTATAVIDDIDDYPPSPQAILDQGT